MSSGADSAATRGTGNWLRTAAAITRRPGLWGATLRQAHRLARRGWWHRPPFLPIPGREYMAFRSETQYGSAQGPPVPGDVLNYLAWCRQMTKLR